MRLHRLLLALAGAMLPAGAAAVELPPNPLLRVETGDPCVLREGDWWYSYSTSGCDRGGSMPIRRSKDLAHWDHVAHLLPEDAHPEWIGGCDFWAPEVHRIGKRLVAYYTARDRQKRFCIGAATAADPAGPFTHLPAPIVRDSRLGLIDPNYFRDPVGGGSYLLWKEDRNDLRPQEPTPIRLQWLTGDGLQLVGEARTILVNDAPWEGVLVEGPELLYRAGMYYLLYSGNVYSGADYGVGVARAEHVEGPYAKGPANPFLHSDAHRDGPGHCFPLEDAPGEWLLFYHARETGKGLPRCLMAEPLIWSADGWPAVPR